MLGYFENMEENKDGNQFFLKLLNKKAKQTEPQQIKDKYGKKQLKK